MVHLPSQAQVHFFSFKDKGKLFYSSPAYYITGSSVARQQALEAEEGLPTFLAPRAAFLGGSLSGQYFLHGFYLGYQLGVGATPKSANTPFGSRYKYIRRDYNGDIIASLGIVALQVGDVRFIPSYGIGVGAWGTQAQYLAQPEGPSGQILHQDKEGAIFSLHRVQDMAMQLIYTLPYSGTSRFSLGAKMGYRQYLHAARAQTTNGAVQGAYGSQGMQGYYTQLHLGIGIFKE